MLRSCDRKNIEKIRDYLNSNNFKQRVRNHGVEPLIRYHEYNNEFRAPTIYIDLSNNDGNIIKDLALKIYDKFKEKFGNEFEVLFDDRYQFTTFTSSLIIPFNRKNLNIIQGNIENAFPLSAPIEKNVDAKKMFEKISKKYPEIKGILSNNPKSQERINQVQELFESNPELANAVYEALGFDNVITSTDKIVWGHPAIGKTTMLESNPDAFIDWDNEFNRKRDSWIASKSNTKIGTPEFKKARNEYMINYNNHKDYVTFVKEEWNKAKEKANKENKTLIASPHMLLNLFPNDFDKVITMSDKTFMDRAIKRSGGDEVNSKLWKEGINETLKSVDKSKIIETDKFINDLFIIPQQKQKAQQLYSSYLQTTNNPTIEGFKQWNNKQQQINELFESNPELASQIYEALGFNNQKDKVRLYRIENKNIPYDESREGIVSKKEIVGGFFTDNIDTVSNYIRKNQSQEGINLVYVDISKNDLDKYHVSKNEYAKTMDVESDNWIIPSDINRSYVDLSSLSKVTGNFMTLSKAKQELKSIVNNLPISQITPQQKATAQQLYSQYLEQNPNGSVEQFKSWVEEFNRSNQKLNSNIQIFSNNKEGNFDSSSLKDDDLALMLFNQALGLNLTSANQLTWDNIKDNIFFEKENGSLGVKNLAFTSGNLLSTKKATLNDFINQKGLFPEHKVFIGESVIYPNVFETLEENEIIKQAVFENLFNLSGAFEQVKEELNKHSPETFIIQTPNGKFTFPKRFAAGFWNIASKVELLLKENQSSYIQDYLADKRKKEEVIKDGKKIKPVITQTLTVNDTIVQNAINLIGNSIIENAIKSNTSVKIQVFSNAEFSEDDIAGWYLPASNTIYLHESMLKPQHLSEGLPLIAHELIHSVTEQSLQFDKDFQREIQSLLDSVKSQSKIKDFYGFKNTSEFLSEAFSSQEFRQLLKDTQFSSTENLSVWQKFVNAILKLFGKNKKYREKTITTNAEQILNSIINQHYYKIGYVNSTIDDKINSNQNLSDFISQKSQEKLNQIKDVFDNNPELSRVGTVEQYASYLDTIGVTDIGYHHSESDLESFTTFSEGYFPKELKKKGTHYKEADDIVFFVKKPLTEEFMSKRKFIGTWGLKIPNTLQFNAGEKIGEGVHPGIDEGIKNAVDGNYDAVDFGRIRDNKTWSEVVAITNPKNAVKLGSKQDIEGFKKFVQGKPTFDVELAQKIQNKLQKLYPEIKLNITNNPIWELGDNIFNQEEYNNQVNYRLKSVELLLSDKAVQIFEKGKKANWDLNKILTELQVPKEQKQLLLDLNIKDNKPDVILPIGTSGSGKSTFIKSLPQENLVVIEPDAMRVEFTGDMNNKSKDKEIYEEAAKRAIQAIKQGKQVVFDTTNLTKDKRLPFIEAIKKEIPTANIQYKLMELNPELAKQRIKADIAAGKNRANVPDATIDRHAESYKQMLEDIKSEPISEFKSTDLREQLALELASKYGFSVEINTAKANFKRKVIDEVTGEEYIDDSEATGEDASYYSNLTVPGGTNYTENEISTPLITPSIKGHAQFSTDNGIGWFRSDEQITTSGDIKEQQIDDSEYYNLLEKLENSLNIDLLNIEYKQDLEKKISNELYENNKTDIDKYFTLREEIVRRNVNTFLDEDNRAYQSLSEQYINKQGSKTRRILEIQSDLFQKGRDKKNLIKPTVNEYDVLVEQDNQNQFLQLLNKDSNWVTFFIKSIIQDSAKKGYEKVLFPKGETAAKIEGHETIAEEIEKIDNRLKEYNRLLNLSDEEFKEATNVKDKQIGNVRVLGSIYNSKTKESIQKEIDNLEQERNNLKSQGIEKLKPIEAFYEIKVGNILEKLFGKDNVKTITDEYGNQWREIIINQARDLQDILLQKNEAGRIIGQANIKAMTVLVDAINQKQDTLPHEYAHHYIAWFRNTPIVQEAIKKWGSEEALVQSIGEQVVKQKGEAYNWWNKFVKWIMNQFNSLSKLQKEELTQILTDAFLTRQDLGSKQDIEGFKDFAQGKQFQKLTQEEKVKTIEQPNTLFGLNTQNQEQLEFHVNTLNVVSQFLENVGIERRLVSEFLSQDGSVVEGAIAAANFIEGTVDIIDDLDKGRAEAWNKLPEEAAHWWYRLLDTNSPLKKALWESHQTALKNDELYAGQYGKLVKSPSDLTEESIGQLIAEAIKRIETENGAPEDYSFFKKFLEWINSIIDIFKDTTQDPFEVAAMKILSSDMSDLMTWEEYRKLNNIVNFADIVTEQSVAPIDYTIINDLVDFKVEKVSYGNNIVPEFTLFIKGDVSNYEPSILDEIKFNTKEELDNYVYQQFGKEYDKRQKQILQEVRDNQIFFDRLLNKTFRKKSKFLPKTLRKYYDIVDAQNLNPLREWNISQVLQQITKKLSEQEKKQIIETNGYTNIAPTLKVLPDLLQKYKKNHIVLSESIKIDGAKKQELSIINGIKDMIKLENPTLKSITAEEFVNEAHNWLQTNYLLGFANEKSHLSYRTNQTFSYLSDRLSNEDVDITNMTEEELQRLPFEERQRIANIVGLTKQNPDVYHNKVSLRFNDMYHLKSGHFDKSPSAWGNLTYFYTGKNKWKDAVLLHEIQNDNIEFLREFKAEKVDLETSLGRYLQQLNTDLLDNITQIESGDKRIIKKDSSEEFRKTHLQLNYQLLQLKDLPLEQGLSQLKQRLNEQIELYKSDNFKNPELAQEAVEKAYSQRRIFQDFKKRGGIKSFLTKEELEEIEDILKDLNINTPEQVIEPDFDEDGYVTIISEGGLEQKKQSFLYRTENLKRKLTKELHNLYGANAPIITLTAPAKPRTKNQIRQGVQRSQELNENVNFLIAYSEKQISTQLSKNIEESKKNYIFARNATVAYNFNVQLSKITLEQWGNLVENYKYNEDLLKRLIDEQAQKDIQKQSTEVNPEDNPLISSEFYETIDGLPLNTQEVKNEIHFGTWEFGYGDLFFDNVYYYAELDNGKLAKIKKTNLKDAIIKSNTKEGKKTEQQTQFEKLKQKALDKKAELEKNYGKIEEEVKQTLEIEMNYFTPLVHHLIQKHINQYGKDFPMYFSGYQITKLTQGNDRTALIYAGKDEINIVNKKEFKYNEIYYKSDDNGFFQFAPFLEDNRYFIKNNEYINIRDHEQFTITEQEYNKAKQEYEKAYQQATKRRAKEIKFIAASQIGIVKFSDFENTIQGISEETNIKKLSDKQLEEGIKKLNEYKKQSKQNMDRVINTIMNISNSKPIETGAIYNAMAQISGVKLIWQDKIDGLQGNTGGYLVDLSNYNYNTPILYGLYKKSQNIGYKQELIDEAAKNTVAEENVDNKLNSIVEIFNKYPELSKIGTYQEYSEYLDTIFPNSKIKDIVYHGTMEQLLPKDGNFKGYITYFTTDKKYAETFGVPVNRKVVEAVLDIKDPYNSTSELADVPEEIHDKDEYTNPRIIKATTKGFDSVIGVDAGQEEGKTIAVFNPEQIHILGSKQDIEGFKKFTKRQSNDINNQENNNIEQSQINENNTESFTKESLNKKIDELLKSGEIYYTDDDSKPCAANGLRNTVKGTDWKIATEFKGKSHAQGGIDITLNENGYHFRRGGKDIKAANGLIIENK